jgi:signal transduction histidine kinase
MTALITTVGLRPKAAREERPSGPSGGRTSAFYALLPALALTAGICISLFARSDREGIILPLEVFADLFIVFFAFRHRCTGARWWRAAALSLLIVDSFYLVGHLAPNYPGWAFMTQEAFYSLSGFMIAAYLFSNLPPFRELETAEKAILLLLSLGITYISVHYLIVPYFTSGKPIPLFFRVNGVLNRLSESAVFPLALLLGMKARSRYWLCLTHGITLLSITSIALGYYISANGGTASIPVQEYGWLCGLLMILLAQAYSPAASAPFAKWNSARVRLVWLVLLFNLALLAALYAIRTFISENVLQLTSILFVFFGLWLVANFMAFRISEDISLLLENLDAGGAPVSGPAYSIAVYEAQLLADKLLAAYDNIRSQSRLAALATLSAQVAHDIRSPLAALDSALKDISQLPEEKRRLIHGAAGRIRDIANDLLEKNRQGRTQSGPQAGKPDEPRLLLSLIEPVVTEKRLQYRNRPDAEIEARLGPESYGLFARVDPVELGRTLSNLINNSVEALERSGSVTVALFRRGARP